MIRAKYCFFLFKQKTAYDMRISDWSSDVCSSDLQAGGLQDPQGRFRNRDGAARAQWQGGLQGCCANRCQAERRAMSTPEPDCDALIIGAGFRGIYLPRSEEHTTELQSLMRLAYAVFFFKKNKRETTSCNIMRQAQHKLSDRIHTL